MTGCRLIAPAKQELWGWPAAANFILGGMGTGLYLFSLAVGGLEKGGAMGPPPAAFKMLAAFLICIGFLSVAIESGRPLRGFYALFHWHRSWISRETLAFLIAVPAMVFDGFFPHPLFLAPASVAAFALMLSQGFILYRSRAISAWNVPIMTLFFVTSGIASGGGLLLILHVLRGLLISRELISAISTVLVLNLVVWLLYLRWSREPAFKLAVDALYRPSSTILTVCFGHLIPLLLFFMFLANTRHPTLGMESASIAMLLSGAAVLAGVVRQKADIIMVSGYTRGLWMRCSNEQEIKQNRVVRQ